MFRLLYNSGGLEEIYVVGGSGTLGLLDIFPSGPESSKRFATATGLQYITECVEMLKN